MDTRLLKGGALAAGALALLGWETLAQPGAKDPDCSSQLKPYLEQIARCAGLPGKITACETKGAELGKDLDAKKGELEAKKKELTTCLARPLGPSPETVTTLEKRAKQAESIAKEAKTKADEAEVLAKDELAKAKALGLELEEERGKRLKGEEDLRKLKETDAAATIARLQKELEGANGKIADARQKLGEVEQVDSGLRREVEAAKERLADASKTVADQRREVEAAQARGGEARAVAQSYEQQIVSALNGLVQQLHEKLECASFAVEMRNGDGVLKGTVADAKHREEVREMLNASPLKPLVKRLEIDLTKGAGTVCFERTRLPGWTMARDRRPGDPFPTVFLLSEINPSLIPLLPPASDCKELGAVLESLEPLDPRPFERAAVWVRGKGDMPSLCERGDAGEWGYREVLPGNTTREGWILAPESAKGANR